MKKYIIITLVAFVLVAGTAEAAQPIWTDHNINDPGIAAPHAPGEKGGTQDLNIGIGERKAQNNQTDFAFLRERASIAHADVR